MAANDFRLYIKKLFVLRFGKRLTLSAQVSHLCVWLVHLRVETPDKVYRIAMCPYRQPFAQFCAHRPSES